MLFALLDDQPSGLCHLYSVGLTIVIMVKDIAIVDIKLVLSSRKSTHLSHEHGTSGQSKHKHRYNKYCIKKSTYIA